MKRKLSIFLKVSSLSFILAKLAYSVIFLGTLWTWLPLYILRKTLTKMTKILRNRFLGGRKMNKNKLLVAISVYLLLLLLLLVVN